MVSSNVIAHKSHELTDVLPPLLLLQSRTLSQRCMAERTSSSWRTTKGHGLPRAHQGLHLGFSRSIGRPRRRGNSCTSSAWLQGVASLIFVSGSTRRRRRSVWGRTLFEADLQADHGEHEHQGEDRGEEHRPELVVAVVGEEHGDSSDENRLHHGTGKG